MTEMSASRSAAGVTVFDGRIFVSGGHDGLQIFNTVSLVPASGHVITLVCFAVSLKLLYPSCPAGGVLQPPH